MFGTFCRLIMSAWYSPNFKGASLFVLGYNLLKRGGGGAETQLMPKRSMIAQQEMAIYFNGACMQHQTKMILFIRQVFDGIKIEVKALHEECVEFFYSHLVEWKPSFRKPKFFLIQKLRILHRRLRFFHLSLIVLGEDKTEVENSLS